MYDGSIIYYPTDRGRSIVDIRIGHGTKSKCIDHEDNAFWNFFKKEYFDELHQRLGIEYYYDCPKRNDKLKGIIHIKYYGVKRTVGICTLWNQIKNNDNY